ncbi:MAG: hypothetical protein JWO95_2455 [Verrucomicrobiales bacterium]|nr:hypothetical protein [Verrucomicrobiales bacterium]
MGHCLCAVKLESLKDMTNGILGKWAVRCSVTALLLTLAHSLPAIAQTTFGTGTFQGIIDSDSDNDEGFGFIRLTLNKTGTFTMAFNVGVNAVGHHYYVKVGKFDSSGHWSISGTAPDPGSYNTRYELPINMSLQLDSIDNPTRITGELDDYTHSSHIEIERIFVASRGNLSPHAGSYTFLFAGTHQPDPDGTGWGRAIVSPYGYIYAYGVTPDGRPFAQGANVTVYDRWPVFTKMAGVVNGIFSGWLNFDDRSDSDFTSQLTWIGPEEPGPNHAFVPQFVTTINVVGSRWVYTPHMTALQLNSVTNNIHLTFTDGGLENQIDRNLTLNQFNRVIFAPHQLGDSMYVLPTIGLFGGTFKHTDGRIYLFRGAILQKQNYGGGQFVTIDHNSGSVNFNPN